MEHQKILNLLNESINSKFVTIKWNIVNDNSKAGYGVEKQNTYNTKFLKSNLCNYINAFILVRGDITVRAADETQLALKNCAPFTKRIKKIDGTAIDGAEELDLVMRMYNLIDCSSNYFETTGSLWFYSKIDVTNFNTDIKSTNDFKYFTYKAKLIGNTFAGGANGILKNATISVPLKY